MAPKTTSLAITPEVEARWTPAQVELIRAMCAKNCTDDEFKVLLYVANKYDLDPLTKQIYAQKYGGENPQPAAIIITYAGMQEIANRDNMLDGLSCEAIWAEEGRNTRTLIGARSTLWKKGCAHPFVVEVDFNEYIQYERFGKNAGQPMGLWKTKPITMIKKVANAQNIRQAFSLGQMYAEEEMPLVETPAPLEEPKVIEERIPAPKPAEKPKTVTPLAIDEEERRKRIADAAAIDLRYGVQTVTGKGDFLSIPVTAATKCLFNMVGAGSFAETAKLIGLSSLETEIKKRYPDAVIQPQRFAATLHFVFNWAAAQAELQAKREAAHVGTN